jgi:N-acetyl-gamma-glutamyl-phosphate reductase
MIRAAVVGATGFTGSELIRILLGHPDVELAAVTSENHAGKRLTIVHPALEGMIDLVLTAANDLNASDYDVLFLALPHRVSMHYVLRWHTEDVAIIDLSGDFRLSDASTYEQWYNVEHVLPDLVPVVPYGLPELNRSSMAGARLVANPGCYPTASILAMAPLVRAGLVDTRSIIIDAKSGLTGAGAGNTDTTHFANVNDNFRAYGLKTHRHTVEIEDLLGQFSDKRTTVQFTPHLLPVDRGILATCYATALDALDDAQVFKLYSDAYADEPFVRVRNQAPSLKQVRGTNFCDIYATFDDRTGRYIVVSVIDNLMKGAAGQAVQTMNILFSLSESSGLDQFPLQP